jgi:hypothetical protein
MPLTFKGYTLTGGVGVAGGASTLIRGSLDGRECVLEQAGATGISFDPFSFEIPCNCQPQPGDTIVVTTVTFLFVDFTSVEYNLCGGQCRGSFRKIGLALGVEVKRLKWRVR